MSLLQMSMRGAVIILAVIIIRALLLDKLPKKTFLFLWGIALFRLTVPFSVSSELSVYSLLQRNPGIAKVMDERAYDGQEVSGRQDDPGRMIPAGWMLRRQKICRIWRLCLTEILLTGRFWTGQLPADQI